MAEDVIVINDYGLKRSTSTLKSGATKVRYTVSYQSEQILVNKVPLSRIPIETLTRFSLQVRMDVAEQLKMPPPLPMFNYAELLMPKAEAAEAK